MRSFALLCNDPSIPEGQRKRFCEKVIESLSIDQPLKEIALISFRELWIRYDTGGISCGRSLRAALLEEIISAVNQEKEEEFVRVPLSILLGMYHDHAFINANGWYDFEIGHFSESDLSHRVWLSTAAFCLEVDEVADMSDWPIEKIRLLLCEN